MNVVSVKRPSWYLCLLFLLPLVASSSGCGSDSTTTNPLNVDSFSGNVISDTGQSIPFAGTTQNVPVVTSSSTVTVTALMSGVGISPPRQPELSEPPTVTIWGKNGTYFDGPFPMALGANSQFVWVLKTGIHVSPPAAGVGLYTVTVTMKSKQGTVVTKPAGTVYHSGQ
jgi:hypothetical protein